MTGEKDDPAKIPPVWCVRHTDGSVSVSEEEWRVDMWRELGLEVVSMAPEARALAAEAALAAERERLKPLLRVAKIAQWMVKDLDAEKVAEHARNFPGSIGPRIGQTAARTRDLIAALRDAAAIRAEGG